jgi:hypothetical protein
MQASDTRASQLFPFRLHGRLVDQYLDGHGGRFIRQRWRD